MVAEAGRLLVARRLMEGELAGLWEFPGGKLESGEDDRGAIVREFEEEFGLPIFPLSPICETSFLHHGRARALAAWACVLGEKRDFSLLAHLELRWCLPPEVEALDLVPSDRKVLAAVFAWLEAAGRGGVPQPS